MKMLLSRFRQYADSLPGRWRRLTRRDWAWGALALPVVLLLYALVQVPFTPSISDLRKAKSEKASVLMTSDGHELAVFKQANREWVTLAKISPKVIDALIATEDRRFYQHHGMDLKRTLSALFQTVTGDLQGGSTITQQLARNLYPDEIGRAASVSRKIREAVTALKIESVYTKDEILETYLNTVPFLYNAHGIEMAARTYFDKSAGQLDVLESATLVGMLKGTSYYNPVQNPERSVQRRNTVLAQMVKNGTLPEASLAGLQKKPLKIDFERQTETLGAAPHLAQQLKRWLIEWADRNSYNIYADGLVVRTTIDSRLQDLANKAVTRQADRLQRQASAAWGLNAGWKARTNLVQSFVRATPDYKAALESGQTPVLALQQLLADAAFMRKLHDGKTRLQAGFMALDPRNGQVRAWVGSRDFAQDQFDHVQQARRQPGSTFKPFVYGAAFEDGAKPGDTFVDRAVEIPLGNGAFWRPGDGGGPSGASMSLRQGLMYSKNTITAQVMEQVGPAHVAALARSMGVRDSRLEEVMSLALGTSPVTLKEMVTAYGTMANDGNFIEPVLVTQIEDRHGKVLEAFAPKVPEMALPAEVAQTLLDTLRGVIDQGTGTGIRRQFGIQADVAGKTGTTQDNTDGWFILMHPQLVAGAWVGFNDNRITMGNGWGPGARSALPMVGEFFQQALRSRVLDAALVFDAPKFAGSGRRWNTPDGSEEAPPPQAEESGIQNGDLPPEGADQADPVIMDDQPYRPYRPYRLYRDESGAITPENLPPPPMTRYPPVPPAAQDRQRLPLEGQAMPRAYELLPPEGRRPRPAELAPQNVQGDPD
ncbi:transglycosylase domain-containing protein [Polaromonas sp.]|uniref:penicillin-binding protein 1A n=1 Tax=Polaromonas sp. TaxID=1869339 RepID=UPI0013BD74E3|nr:transglycosylase domain-containing protein [Polaromonas sp.]NDP61518.1 penicillin-binding protein [Polaromonas sp.]